MLTHKGAQLLVDGLTAVSVAASLYAIAARPKSAMRPRLLFAFSGIFLLFLLRTAANGLEMPSLSLAALITVCLLPLAALILAEGQLRRHAPWHQKTLVTAGALAMTCALLLTRGSEPMASWGLGLFVILSLLSIALLLWLRDKSSLSAQENAGVTVLVISGLFLILASVTDFLPQAPLGLSGVGVAILAFALAENPHAASDTSRLLLNILGLLIIAGTTAFALGRVLSLDDMAEMIRLGAILASLLLAAASIAGARFQERRRLSHAFEHALARADISSLERFLADLAEQPLLAGLRVVDGPALSNYDAGQLREALARRPVWTRTHLLATADLAERPREELSDLMSRNDATHAILLSRQPVKIALLTLADLGASEDAMICLALFRKFADTIRQAQA